MKNFSSIRRPTLEEVKKKQAEKRLKLLSKPRKVIKRAVRTKKRATGQIGGKKRKNISIPTFLKAIPESQSHGSGTYQKRLWRLVSDFVRIRDWYAYGVCAATGTRIEHWSQGQAGHLKPYTSCNALFKFDVRNIHLQSASSNKWGNFDTFRDFEKVVRNRGYDFDAFERENLKARGSSLRDSDVLEEIKRVLKKMKTLPERPAYYERAFSLMESE